MCGIALHRGSETAFRDLPSPRYHGGVVVALRFLALAATLAGCGRLNFGQADRLADAAPDATDAQTDAPVEKLPEGLILYLPFEGSSSGEIFRERQSGTLASCGPCPTPVVGKVGQAARFDGTAEVLIPDSATVRPAAFTIALWEQLTSSSEATSLGKPLNSGTTTRNSFEFWERMGQCGFGVSYGGPPVFVERPGCSLLTWQHIAGTFDPAVGITLYIDGVLVGSTATTGTVAYATDPITIGFDIDNGVDGFHINGNLDEMMLFNRALTPAEIAALAKR